MEEEEQRKRDAAGQYRLGEDGHGPQAAPCRGPHGSAVVSRQLLPSAQVSSPPALPLTAVKSSARLLSPSRSPAH